MDLVKEITVKSNSLPFELQREVLDFVEFIAHKNQSAVEETQIPFQSVRGILKRRNLENLEQDLSEVRREMWQNFPREEPK
jgi:hypothetical protein